jgi:hypothetical protein
MHNEGTRMKGTKGSWKNFSDEREGGSIFLEGSSFSNPRPLRREKFLKKKLGLGGNPRKY